MTLDNQFVIIDEAHSISGNTFGKFMIDILKVSKNARVFLLTGTLMKNRVDDIVDIINILRLAQNPHNEIINAKDIFDITGYVDEIQFKPGGMEKLARYSYGYFSYLRNTNKLTIPDMTFRGSYVPGLIFSKIYQCKSSILQAQV